MGAINCRRFPWTGAVWRRSRSNSSRWPGRRFLHYCWGMNYNSQTPIFSCTSLIVPLRLLLSTLHNPNRESNAGAFIGKQIYIILWQPSRQPLIDNERVFSSECAHLAFFLCPDSCLNWRQLIRGCMSSSLLCAFVKQRLSWCCYCFFQGSATVLKKPSPDAQPVEVGKLGPSNYFGWLQCPLASFVVFVIKFNQSNEIRKASYYQVTICGSQQRRISFMLICI